MDEWARNPNTKPLGIRRGLVVAVASGILASTCCVGPLILVLLGIGGAWVADIRILDPLRPWLMAVALMFLGYAHVRYWRQRHRDQACGCPPRGSHPALWLWLGTGLVAVAFIAPYALPYFVMHG
ncbi:MAG: mercuric transporter MerT family protein [Acidiferrobacter sp.]